MTWTFLLFYYLQLIPKLILMYHLIDTLMDTLQLKTWIIIIF